MTTTAITEEDRANARRIMLREGMVSQIMESFTSGIFLVAVALYFDAPNTVIGLLGAIPFLSNLFQIPAIHWIERCRDRRHVIVVSATIARSFLLGIVITPFLPSNEIALTVIVTSVAIRYCLGAMGTCAWNSWVKDLLPPQKAGEFLGVRLSYRMGTATLLSIAAAFFIDSWNEHFPDGRVWSYSLLFLVGWMAAMVSSMMLRTIPHPPMAEPEAEQYDRSVRLHTLMQPLKHENFRKLIWFLFSWNFAVNLTAPFFAVYMIKWLDYDMVFVLVLTVMSQMMHAITLKLWGRYSDQYSNRTVLRISGSLFVFCILLWVFTAMPSKHAFTTPLLVGLHMLMGIGMAGVTLASSNIALKLAPQTQATSFLAVQSILISIAAGTAPLFGGLLADLLERNHSLNSIVWFSNNFHQWDVFFLISFCIGLYSLRVLMRVEEEGAVAHHVAVRAMMIDTNRRLRGISTIAGMRDAAMYPLKMMVNQKRNDN